MSWFRKTAVAPLVEDSIDIAASRVREAQQVETRAIRDKIARQWPEVWDRYFFTQDRLVENDLAGAFEKYIIPHIEGTKP